MSSDVLDGVLRRIGDLPALPHAVARIIELCRDPDVQPGTVHDAIAVDPALTARIVKLANSSFFGFSSKVSSLRHSIVLLGYKRIESLAVAAMSCSMCAAAGDQRWALALWDHSVASAMAARSLARRRIPARTEEAFLAGLLHDMGKAVMMSKFPDAVARAAARVGLSDKSGTEIEYQTLGFSHDQIALLLLRQWKFPEQIVDAVGHHHRPSGARADPGLTKIVGDASLIASRLGHNLDDWVHRPEPGEPGSEPAPEEIARAEEEIEKSAQEWTAHL